ncbi:MAG: hypothetical protein ACXVLO_01615 [Acidimicrobiia bacterium]
MKRIGIVVVATMALSACSLTTPFRPIGPSSAPKAPPIHSDGQQSPGAVVPALANRAGFNPGSTILWMDDEDRQRELDAMAATGARWIALDFDWASIQGDGPDSFRWDRSTDTVVREARARKLKIVATLAYSPPWARRPACADTSHCLPQDPATFARFAAAAVARYGPAGTEPGVRNTVGVWQIWNEANHVPFVEPTVDVPGYTTLLRDAYAQIKAVDPTATVLAGATAPAPDDPTGVDVAPVTFLRGIYANGGGGSFDAFSHHPYTFPDSPLVDAPWNAFTQTAELHQVMVEHGDGAKKIWGTESGAATGTDPKAVSNNRQAQLLQDYFTGWNGWYRSFTGPLLWYSVRDESPDPADLFGNCGILTNDFRAKPARTTLRSVLHGG